MGIQPERTAEFVHWVQEKYADTVYRMALLQTKQRKTAESVYREVFLRLAQEPPPFEDEEHLKTWLVQTAIHCSQKHISLSLFSRTAANEFDMPEQRKLFCTLTALPRKYRTVVLLYEAEGYNLMEIAGLLHKRESTVRRQLSRVRSKLEEAQVDALYGYRLEGLLKSIQAGEELKQTTAEKMLGQKSRRVPVLKYTAFIVLAVLILFGCILVPFMESKTVPFRTTDVASIAKGTESKPAPLTGNDIEVTLVNDDMYPSKGSSGSGDGVTMTWTEDIDFNLRCTGENIKRVTYTANNCEFLKKSFFTREQVETRQVNRNVFSSLMGSGEGNDLIYWGFSPIGYIYSADYEEQLNPSYFGLRLNYVEENVKEFENDREKEDEKLFRLSEQAYGKAYITVEVEREDGSVVAKNIRLLRDSESGKVTILVADIIFD